MSNPIVTPLPGSRVELKFVVTVDEARPSIDRAVEDISTNKPIKGFRSGKAGYADVKAAYGEMLIWETAFERIVRAMYLKAVRDNTLETVGSPELAVEKLVPNQDIVFTLTASLMPTVTNLTDYTKPLVTKKIHTITEEEVAQALQDLRTMRRTEAATHRAAMTEDAIAIDLDIKKDNVSIEGGATHDYKLYLNEPHYIPGFTEQLVGLRRGDVKTFELEFPKEHYNALFAGQRATFIVTVKDVFELTLPELDDTFAKSVGLETLTALHELLRKNLQEDADKKSNESAELELLNALVKDSQFSDIPELLMKEEVRRMIHELEYTAEQRGMKFEAYLESIKKTTEDIKRDFVPQAIERVQTAVLIKEIGKRENIEVTDSEVETEQDRLLDSLPKDDKEARERIVSVEYRDHLATLLKNRKILALLKAKGVK